MLTDPGDLVVDPFAGSCVTGEVAERLERKWACCDLVEDNLRGGLGRFDEAGRVSPAQRELFTKGAKGKAESYYRVYHPGSLWNGIDGEQLRDDGGKERPASVRKKTKPT